MGTSHHADPLSRGPERALAAGGVALLGALALACGSKSGGAPSASASAEKPKLAAASSSAAATTANAPASSTASPTSTAVQPEVVKNTGPTVTIPAGTLNLGFACGAVPRITDEEHVHRAIQVSEFTIDVFPYPNDPQGAAPKTGVTRDEAAGLCQANGKRLCTEVEWERACKGPKDQTFEYGNVYDASACKDLPGALTNARGACASGFGVKDMHGLVLEWTSGEWGRGTTALAPTRGSFGKNDVVHDRCAAGRGKSAATSSSEIGFRCCSGGSGEAMPDLPIQRDAPLTEDPSIDSTLAAALLKVMPADHQAVTDATVAFDKLWRWHPRANVELLVARWIGRPQKGSPWFEIAVFKACGASPGVPVRMRGPVRTLKDPTVGTNVEKLSIDVATKADTGKVEFTYWYGGVHITEPSFIMAGNSLPSDEKPGLILTRPILKKRK
ncbi:MAG: SUMF1/EgtB/PvdO family nonheme iron enzyme [Polyangiaceae bacterium]